MPLGIKTIRFSLKAPAASRAVAAIALILGGCADPLELETDGAYDSSRWLITELPVYQSGGPSCPAVSNCSVQFESGQERCVCELKGLDVSAAGGDPPPPPPDWPEPAGWTWPERDVYYAGGYSTPPNGSACDPNAFYGGCEWAATVSCPTGVARGSYVTCVFSIDLAGSAVQGLGWTFQGNHSITSPSGYYETTWSGIVVESGKVAFHFVAGGAEARAVSYIEVVPRSWSWDGSRRSFATAAPGQVDNCITGGFGLTADYIGCSAGQGVGVLINPGMNQGFTISPASGPNAGLWYVTNPTTRMDLRAQMNPKYRQDGTKRLLTGDSNALSACQSAYAPSSIPTQNTHSVNTTCFQIADFSSMSTYTWNHEGQHLSLAQGEAQKSGNDIYSQWEGIVETSQNAAFTLANTTQNGMHLTVTDTANSIHNGPPPIYWTFYRHVGSGVWQAQTLQPAN